MVVIRNGGHLPPKSRKSSLWIVYLPQLFSLCLVAAVSLYCGVLFGMRMNCSPTPQTLWGDGEDFNRRVQREVERRIALVASTNNASGIASKSKQQKGGARQSRQQKGDNPPRRFPTTVSKFATGASLMGKNDFLSNFDYGIPKPPSKREHESDPGNDEVLLLYGSEKTLPDINVGTIYQDEKGDAPLPRLSAQDATKNCAELKVMFTNSRGAGQCIAIVGNYESYHIQRWMRIDPRGGSKWDASKALTPVGRGLQDNGQDKFSAPNRAHTKQNQALLETYFSRLDDSLATLKPMAKACAGTDNTVIVMVCNTGQSDLLLNFICSAKARGFGDVVMEKVLVFATDEGVLKIAKGLGLRTFYDKKIFEKMPEKEANTYGDRAFTQMMYAKVVTVQLINHLGHDVLFQDVDLVWYKNPISFFHDKSNPLYAFDMLFQDDGARSLRYAPYSANTGFYYVRNNAKTKFLFRNLLFMGDMVLSMTSHQQALAALLDEHSSLTGLRVKTMSGVDFPGGYHYHRKKEISFLKDIVQGKHVPFLLHMSWTTNKLNKLLFLKQMGLWYTKEECEKGGGVEVADRLSDKGSFETACCSAGPLVTCHYSDKPSVEQCKHSKTGPIDRGGKSFW